MGVIAILAGVFITTSFLTSFMTNRASIAIVLPVAISLANALNADVKPFILAVAFSAAANFATPIGYQTNLMVYGPGNYSFKDYLKIGTPLTLLYFIICITLLSYLYIL
jgi:di/tricarboxylate transporter